MINDLHVCRESAMSKFIQVKASKVVHLDLQPFLTGSQIQNGFETSWFKYCHLQEILSLLKSPLETCLEAGEDVDAKKKPGDKEFVLTGTTIRAACSLKSRPEGDIFLTCQATSPENRAAVNGHLNPSKLCVRQLHVHEEKLLCFVCPRSHSSAVQLSQIVTAASSSGHEDISKYFQPATS